MGFKNLGEKAVTDERIVALEPIELYYQTAIRVIGDSLIPA